MMVDGEEVPAWLFEEVTEERPPENLVLDTWVPPAAPSAPSERARGAVEPTAEVSEARQRRAVSAYQRLKR
jgi:hypothetical protein